MEPAYSPAETAIWANRRMQAAASQTDLVSQVMARFADKIARDHAARGKRWLADLETVTRDLQGLARDGTWAERFNAYRVDAGQRAVLTLDALRQRGDTDHEHAEAGTPPVLIYDHEVAVDGAKLPRPVNYSLLRILPPPGTEVLAWKRPYVIIDPRAGHGAGIGGFKTDSQVGVALRDGHPVYFVVFGPHPVKGQTLADITHAEAEFVREVARRHPDAPKPIIVGNCQGGWATLVLGATNPDIIGPLVINGAPVAYWSGDVGDNPMRYKGGLAGGMFPVMLLSDLGHGVFDGAHLVQNFEELNPSRHLFGKYYDLYADIDSGIDKFLEFERWWGGFHFMNEAEIRWIVEQLFVGNRLARGEARLEHGRPIDLKRIRSPIIVFASHGDNITPPAQALDWIVDTYADEDEIRIRGQRIIYMVHDKVGHLGIFVSSSIAKKEHSQVASTLKTIETLAPGLYEMTIDDEEGEGADARFLVSFQERKLADIEAIGEGHRAEHRAFAAVDRVSQVNAEIYDLTMRPFVQSLVSPAFADAMHAMHPARAPRLALSSRNPLVAPIAGLAKSVQADRKIVGPHDPFRAAERLWAEAIQQSLDMWRDWRDLMSELMFLGVYASPTMSAIGQRQDFERARRNMSELRALPEVQALLHHVASGGVAEAVVRMMIVLADARGSVRRSRLERAARMLHDDEPFASLTPDDRSALIHEQSVIVELEKEAAIAALPRMLPTPKERMQAVSMVEGVAGPLEEMESHTIQTIQRFRKLLDLPPLAIAETASAAAAE